jgi:glycosyltransferase involved in cell wall biosynthesis
MRIGVVSKWFNRGQPIVGRHLRSALDELGHETFVLARPMKEERRRPGLIQRDDVWDQPRVTEASAFDVPLAEYREWVDANGIEAIFCDQNYSFDELADLRRSGVRTIGRFVWEAFGEQHVEGAREAYDVVYSLTECERERYRAWGMETPFVLWGCHPEMTEVVPRRPSDRLVFIYPGGYLGRRKPTRQIVEGFLGTKDPDFRLLVKFQLESPKHGEFLIEAAGRDPRIELLMEDQPRAEHLQTFADCHVCVTPARWEGLGLPLYEALAFGMPIITNDNPPMNEVALDGVNGLLVTGHRDGEAKSGIPGYAPDVGELTAAMERMGDPEVRERLTAGAEAERERRSWARTVEGIAGLIDSVQPPAAAVADRDAG